VPTRRNLIFTMDYLFVLSLLENISYVIMH